MQNNVLPHRAHPGALDLHVPLRRDPDFPDYRDQALLKELVSRSQPTCLYLLRGLGLDVKAAPDNGKRPSLTYDQLQDLHHTHELFSVPSPTLAMTRHTILRIPCLLAQLVLQTNERIPQADVLVVAAKLAVGVRYPVKSINFSADYALPGVYATGLQLVNSFHRLGKIFTLTDNETLTVVVEGSVGEVLERVAGHALGKYVLDVYDAAALRLEQNYPYFYNEAGELDFMESQSIIANQDPKKMEDGRLVLAHYRARKLKLLS